MTSRHLLTFLFALRATTTSAPRSPDPCGGGGDLRGPRGNVTVDATPAAGRNSCGWRIVPPWGDAITTIRVDAIRRGNVTGDGSFFCLTVAGGGGGDAEGAFTGCDEELSRNRFLAMRTGRVQVTLETVNVSVRFRMVYTTRRRDECPHSEFRCEDGSGCFNSTTDLERSDSVCDDRSDKLGSGGCNVSAVPCSNLTSMEPACFHPAQRCDDSIHCPKGEDELNCSASCPGGIRCYHEDKCISPYQICDMVIDCSTGWDEQHCGSNASKTLMIIVMFMLCTVCSAIFLCVIFRWLSTRRDANRLLENMPRFPLEPFQGPGGEFEEDTSSGSEILESDFRQGGAVYESYLQNIKRRSVSKSIHAENAKFSHLELDGENELVVLASLNVPLDSCKRLRVPRESLASLIENGVNRKCRSEELRQEAATAAGRSSMSDTLITRRRGGGEDGALEEVVLDVFSDGSSSQWTDMETRDAMPAPRVIWVKGARRSPEVKRRFKKKPGPR